MKSPAREALKDADGRFWKQGEWSLHVVDENGATACRLRPGVVVQEGADPQLNLLKIGVEAGSRHAQRFGHAQALLLRPSRSPLLIGRSGASIA